MGILINPTHFFRKVPEQFRYERVKFGECKSVYLQLCLHTKWLNLSIPYNGKIKRKEKKLMSAESSAQYSFTVVNMFCCTIRKYRLTALPCR